MSMSIHKWSIGTNNRTPFYFYAHGLWRISWNGTQQLLKLSHTAVPSLLKLSKERTSRVTSALGGKFEFFKIKKYFLSNFFFAQLSYQLAVTLSALNQWDKALQVSNLFCFWPFCVHLMFQFQGRFGSKVPEQKLF